MTFTNTDSLTQSVKALNKLDVNEQLIVLASLYADIKGSVTQHPTAMSVSSEVDELVKQINDMRQEDQVQFLRDVLSEKATQSDAVALDPHPTKAMLELLPGGVTPPLKKYQDMSVNSRLTLWYYLGQGMESQFSSIIASNPLSPEATQLVDSLKQGDFDQQIAFLDKVV